MDRRPGAARSEDPDAAQAHPRSAQSSAFPFPWTTQIEGELREFRAHFGEELYRILYRRSKNLIILLHIIRKTSGALPAADVAVAKARWADFRARMDAPKRARPRAAGHDAP